MTMYKKIRRLAAITLSVVIAGFGFGGNCSLVQAAGGINANESRVIGVANGTFEYNGETYVAQQTYIDQLTAKLSQDGVDLTAEQAEAAISQIYANVATGVEAGYIVKVSGQKGDGGEITDKPNESDNPKASKKPKATAEPTAVPQIVKQPGGTVIVNDSTGNQVAKVDGMLKNTGLSLAGTYAVLEVLALIIMIVIIGGVICAIKNIQGRGERYGS